MYLLHLYPTLSPQSSVWCWGYNLFSSQHLCEVGQTCKRCCLEPGYINVMAERGFELGFCTSSGILQYY